MSATARADSRRHVLPTGRRRYPIFFTIAESVRGALSSVRAHAFRSFLTTLGIIIGVASVIAMVSIIQGLQQTIDEQFQGLGTNSITVASYTPFEERLQGRISRLTQADYDLIRYRVDGIESITPILYSQQGVGQVRYGSQTAYAQILGTRHTYQEVGQYYTATGRFISDSDEKTRRRVATIGEQVREDLALPEDPTGEFIQVNGEWIRLIGVLEEKGDVLGQSQDNLVIMPYSTMQSLMGNARRPDIQIALTVSDVERMPAISEIMRRLLRNSRGLAPDQDDDFRIQTAEELTATLDSIITNVTAVVAGIVSISLLVGGIGIMNIMLVSVTERTREIGICKAIGAKRHHILMQFLLEALILCLIGGVVGLGFGYGIAAIVASLIPGFPSAYTPLWAVALALGFSLAVGMIFGILPAAKAANLDPISSLRYE